VAIEIPIDPEVLNKALGEAANSTPEMSETAPDLSEQPKANVSGEGTAVNTAGS
jgi:hypothetical protein